MSALHAAFEAAKLANDMVSIGRTAPALINGALSRGEILAFTARVVKVSLKLRELARDSDADAMDEMVALMQERAPVRRGVLRQGITGHTEGDMRVVTAVAYASRGGVRGADYAPFVEHGTEPRGADESYFETSVSRPREGHPGTDAQPFFWNSAREVLGRRREAMATALDEMAAEGI